MIVTRQAFDNYRRPPIRFSRRGPGVASLKALTASASGSVNNVPNRATLAASIPKLTNIAVGAMGLSGTFQKSLNAHTEIAVGNIGVKGAATASLPTVTVALLGQIGTVSPGTGAGVATDTLQAFTETSQGIIGVSARVTNSLQTLTTAAQGTYVAPGIQGTATDTLRPFSLPSQTFPSAVTGTFTATLPVITLLSSPIQSLTHNVSFTVSGSGFGTKVSTTAPTAFDYGASGVGNLDSTWDVAAPNYGGAGASGGGDTAYFVKNVSLPHSNGGTSSGVPHPNVSIALSGCASGTGAAPSTNCYIGKFCSFTGAKLYSYWSFWHRMANNWVFGTGSPNDSNYKFWGIGCTHDTIYTFGNCYVAYSTDSDHGSTGMNNTSNDGSLKPVVGDDTGFAPPIGGGGIYAWGNHDPSSGNLKNYAKGWVHQEILVRWSEDPSTGYWIKWDNNVSAWNSTYQSATDSRSNSFWNFTTDRTEGIGGFRRDSGTLNRDYFCDVYFSRDANPGRFILTNNATYTSSTIVECQLYTNWTDTSVTLTCKKGALSSGTVHLHYRNEDTSHQYLGPYTMT